MAPNLADLEVVNANQVRREGASTTSGSNVREVLNEIFYLLWTGCETLRRVDARGRMLAGMSSFAQTARLSTGIVVGPFRQAKRQNSLHSGSIDAGSGGSIYADLRAYAVGEGQ